jgi:tetratricopeptide (TPR) repeat protein
MPTAHHSRDPATSPARTHPTSRGTARHPLAALRHIRGWSGQRYLIEINRHHQRLGFGAMATNRKKISQWESGLVTPELSAQLAIAALEHIPEEAVHRLGWPNWLLPALDDDSLTCTPWTLEATRHALIETASGGTMDRRGFLLATGTALTATAATWSSLLDTPASGKIYPRIGMDAINGLHARLTHLSHLDDVLGSRKLRELASAELNLITSLLTDTTHTTTIEQQLYSLAAEASRICGWLSYDSGHHTAAQRYYLTALRASATADDVLIGANTMAFMAVQHYTIGTPHDAITLTQTARTTLTKRTTPKTTAILHAREARAHAKLGNHKACTHALDAAFTALTTNTHEPPWTYWVTPTEIHMLAGSCALDLNQPHQALHHFNTAHTHFDTTTYPAGAAIYHARTAQAHLALNDIDAAAHHATQALHYHTTINSTRGDHTLTTLRNNLTPHHTHPTIHTLLNHFPQPRSRN